MQLDYYIALCVVCVFTVALLIAVYSVSKVIKILNEISSKLDGVDYALRCCADHLHSIDNDMYYISRRGRDNGA